MDVPAVDASTLVTQRFSVSDDEGGDGNDDAAAGGAAVAAAGVGDGALGTSANGSAVTEDGAGVGRWPLRAPRPETCVVHSNNDTGLLNAVPMLACRQFWSAQF
jgi:hypothetical protein